MATVEDPRQPSPPPDILSGSSDVEQNHRALRSQFPLGALLVYSLPDGTRAYVDTAEGLTADEGVMRLQRASVDIGQLSGVPVTAVFANEAAIKLGMRIGS